MNGSLRGWRPPRTSDTLRTMSGFFAAFAGKRNRNASKEISTWVSYRPQTERKEVLVRPVEREWRAPMQGTRVVLRDEPVGSSASIRRHPQADQRGKRQDQQATGQYTFERFCHSVYLPMFQRKWKASTCDTETDRIEHHLVRELGPKLMKEISDEQLQQLLNERAKNRSQSVVDHLRFRLRSMFNVALSKGIVDRNPATELYTPRDCKPGREKRVLDPADLIRMLDALNLREQVILRLATCEGMRPGEILACSLPTFTKALSR